LETPEAIILPCLLTLANNHRAFRFVGLGLGILISTFWIVLGCLFFVSGFENWCPSCTHKQLFWYGMAWICSGCIGLVNLRFGVQHISSKRIQMQIRWASAHTDMSQGELTASAGKLYWAVVAVVTSMLILGIVDKVLNRDCSEQHLRGAHCASKVNYVMVFNVLSDALSYGLNSCGIIMLWLWNTWILHKAACHLLNELSKDDLRGSCTALRALLLQMERESRDWVSTHFIGPIALSLSRFGSKRSN
jgi:hypothetical protein